jgi:hypothetical protein
MSVTVALGAGIEKSSITLGLGCWNDYRNNRRLHNRRPSAVIVTNANRDLNSFGNYCVEGWDNSSFTITHTTSMDLRPLYYYAVIL